MFFCRFEDALGIGETLEEAFLDCQTHYEYAETINPNECEFFEATKLDVNIQVKITKNNS